MVLRIYHAGVFHVQPTPFASTAPRAPDAQEVTKSAPFPLPRSVRARVPAPAMLDVGHEADGGASMVSMTVELRNVEGTQAAMGWAGGHTVVVDRPEGKAGGMGLGFNGGQLLALAIGGCFCNDLRYVAEATGVELGRIAVTVTVVLEGDPLLATAATMTVSCETLDGADARDVVERAKAGCMVSNSLGRGVPVTIQAADFPPGRS